MNPSFTYGRPDSDKGKGVTFLHASPELCQEVRATVLDNWDNSPTYQIRRDAAPFLQGFDEKDGWIFVEFWSEATAQKPFVEHLLRIFREHAPEGTVSGVEVEAA